MSIAPEEERFAKNTTIMAQAVQECVQKLYNAGYKTADPATISLVVSMISAFNKHYLIQGFIQNSHQTCWDKIKERKEIFFVENAGDIFANLPMDKVNLFKDLFTTKDAKGVSVIAQSVKDQIWQLFDSMVKISIKYIHKNRSPYSYQTSDGQVVNTYGASFFDEVDIKYHAKIWEVKLEFPLQC